MLKLQPPNQGEFASLDNAQKLAEVARLGHNYKMLGGNSGPAMEWAAQEIARLNNLLDAVQSIADMGGRIISIRGEIK
ncbi:MAG: hypothetical protein U5N55_01460 [Cypionkella sp.]|nr:hypothetical protein [Cypionkella sp.]